MRRDACLEFGRRWGLKVCTIEDLVTYLEEEDKRVGREGKQKGNAGPAQVNGVNGI
jgi:3,4-dihydroxy 2-butanone 4-phosphate synthase